MRSSLRSHGRSRQPPPPKCKMMFFNQGGGGGGVGGGGGGGGVGWGVPREEGDCTPICITIDFESLNDDAVTVRDRDTMVQERVPLGELVGYLAAPLLPAYLHDTTPPVS